MKNKVFIITNESIYLDKNQNYFCDNIDIKSIPENLNKFSEVTLIARKTNKIRSKKIELNKINLSNNIFSYLNSLYASFEEKDIKYLIISLSPYTLLASIILKLFFKKHFIYLRSDGFEEYKAIFGKIGKFLYYFIFKLGIINSNLIACRKHLLKKNHGHVVNPSQLKEKWFKEIKDTGPKSLSLLYIGRLRVEKGIFSLIKILKNTNFKLTIVTAEKDVRLEKNFENIKLISFDNYNDAIIKFYDEHSIFVLPSYTEAHPQVLDEALARCRPVIIFKDIDHVKRDRKGVFICDRNLDAFRRTVEHIKANYDFILKDIKNNKLPTQKNFINELTSILFNQ